jgi:transcriptional regulator with XRE-family HTH domain
MIGINMQRLRQRWKLTQGELGEMIGCSRNQVANWEGGRSLPGIDIVARIEQLATMPVTTRELTLSEIPARPYTGLPDETQRTDNQIRLQRIEMMLERIMEHLNINTDV